MIKLRYMASLFINCSSVLIARILWRAATETKVSRKGARENLPCEVNLRCIVDPSTIAHFQKN